MKIIQRELKVNVETYYKLHLEIINSVIPVKMTDKEIEVLASFMSLDSSITEDDMFNSFARKKVKEKLNNMSAGGLGNHLKSLIDKGFLNKKEITNRISIKEFLIPEENNQGYQFKLVKQ